MLCSVISAFAASCSLITIDRRIDDAKVDRNYRRGTVRGKSCVAKHPLKREVDLALE